MAAVSGGVAKIVVIGAGYAGLATAMRLSRLKGRVAVTVIDANAAFHERIRFQQHAAGQPLTGFPYEEVFRPKGISFVQGQVINILPDAHEVVVRPLDGELMALSYDYLVYALGSSTDLSAMESGQEYVLTLDCVDSASRIHEVVSDVAQPRLLVVGGGLTGIETAAELAESLPQAHIALAMSMPWQASSDPGRFSRRAVDYLYRFFERRNVDVLNEAAVQRLEKGRAMLSGGAWQHVDACIWTCGFKSPTLAADAGIEVNTAGQIVTDSYLRSVSHPDIIAVGDAACVTTTDGGRCRMGCATGLAMAASAFQTLKALLDHRSPVEFRFVYLFRNICLGREDGLIQFVDKRDRPRDLIWTGKAAVRWKDYICRSTLAMAGLKAPSVPPAMPPLRMMPQLLRGTIQYA